MLSLTDILDFIDLDYATVELVRDALDLPESLATELAREFLKSPRGLMTLHQMYADRLAAVVVHELPATEKRLRQAYLHFARKYPRPLAL